MNTRMHTRAIVLIGSSLLAFQWTTLNAQAPVPTKRPLTYDVVDYWRSIGGTRLSDDGQWLAYAVTAPGDDGELIVRNLRSSQEFKHPRGTGPQFTPDGKFVIFTIAQSKADEEKERLQNRGRGARGGEGGENPEGSGEPAEGGRGNQRRQEPRTGLGIMALATGQVTTMDKVGSFRLPEESSTWLAYYKGTGGAGGAGACRADAAGVALVRHQQAGAAVRDGAAPTRAIASSRARISFSGT